MGILLASSLDSLLQLVGVLIIFLFVLAITYFTTRWMGGHQKGKLHNKNLQVIETISVGNNKMISIIEVGTKYIVVSIGKEEVHMLTELTQEQLKDISFLDGQTGNARKESFAEIMDKLKDKLPKKTN